MISVTELTQPSDTEKQLGEHILAAAQEIICKEFNDSKGEQRVFEIERKPLIEAAQTAVGDGATVTHRVRAHMIAEAKAAKWNLEDLAGKKGSKMIFTMRKRGGGGRPKGSKNTPSTEASPPATE